MNTTLLKAMGLTAIAWFVASCSNTDNTTGGQVPEGREITIKASMAYSNGSTAQAIDGKQRVSFNQGTGKINVAWDATDHLSLYTGTDYTTSSDFTVTSGSVATDDNGSTASFTGTIPATATKGTALTAVLTGSNVSYSVENGNITANLATQDGTLASAGKLDVVTGTGTYDGTSTALSMNFDHKMAILKLVLTAPSDGKLTGITLIANSGLYRSVTFNAKTGTMSASKSGNIAISGANDSISAGATKTIYVAVYPGAIKDLYVVADKGYSDVKIARIGSKTINAGSVQTITKTVNDAAFNGAAGTSDAPRLINDLKDLKILNFISTNYIYDQYNSKFYQQTADIEHDDSPWSPMYISAGGYDGGGHTVSGTLDMTYKDNYQYYFGFIGQASENSTIKGINLTATAILPTAATSGHYFGAIVADLDNSTISNCNNASDVTSTFVNTGGIVGFAYIGNNGTSMIIHCTNSGNIVNNATLMGTASYTPASLYNTPCTSGIVASLNGASVVACKNTGNITTTNGIAAASQKYSTAGGIVGYAYSTSKKNVRGCVNTGSVTCANGVAGGIIGVAKGSTSNTTTNSVTADNSLAVSCWTSIGTANAPSLTGNTTGLIVGYSTNANYYYCAAANGNTLNYWGTSNSSAFSCIRYDNTTGNTLADWLTGKTINMNTAWKDAASADTYKFDSSGNIVAK